MDNATTSFLSKLIDWKDFELFVAEMYREGDDVIVDHNVTEIGKSGAKRQVDVRVLRKNKLHTVKTIIECKFWKSKVDRPVIDVLAAAIDDLNANHGVIFTTLGFEEGAIQYARNKNIDIFIIRDVAEEEWGQPGRFITMYLQFFNGKMTNVKFDNSKFISTTDRIPEHLEFEMHLTKEKTLDPKFQLYELKNMEKGDNLQRLLTGVHMQILQNWVNHINFLVKPEDQEHQLAFVTPVLIKFDNYSNRYLLHENGYIMLDMIRFDFLQTMNQSKLELDRAGSADFVLIVENYITQQRNFISRFQEQSNMLLSDPIAKQEEDKSESFQNGGVVKIILDYFVETDLKPDTKIQTTPQITVNLEASPPAVPKAE